MPYLQAATDQLQWATAPSDSWSPSSMPVMSASCVRCSSSFTSPLALWLHAALPQPTPDLPACQKAPCQTDSACRECCTARNISAARLRSRQAPMPCPAATEAPAPTVLRAGSSYEHTDGRTFPAALRSQHRIRRSSLDLTGTPFPLTSWPPAEELAWPPAHPAQTHKLIPFFICLASFLPCSLRQLPEKYCTASTSHAHPKCQM